MSSQLFRAVLVLGFSVFVAGSCSPLLAQEKFVANYDESKVPSYQLPPIWQGDGKPTAERWQPRRAELLQLFGNQMYGTQPGSDFKIQFEKIESGQSFGGKALRQQFRVVLKTEAGEHSIDLLVFTPANATKPVPTFLGLSFYGNHTVADDKEITVTPSWCRSSKDKGVVDNRATEAGRGSSKSRWPVQMIVDAGFGVATCYCGDIDPDFDDGFKNGVHALFPGNHPDEEHPDRWGTISAWAWGLSRMLDCLQEEVQEVDGERVVVIGHSRLGKTSLWTAAMDERFAGAISNDSGCGGAALSRRAFGETVERINTSFPHWFCGNFKQYNKNEHSLPIDQHQLVALLAPRPVYIASASEDRWADPKGEFLSAKLAGTVYETLGFAGLKLEELPPADTAEIGRVSYHLRQGKHNINAWDWANYIRFMQQLSD